MLTLLALLGVMGLFLAVLQALLWLAALALVVCLFTALLGVLR